MAAIRGVMACVLACALTGCGLPPLVLWEDPSLAVAPSGPSVAALVANIKCELWEAANDTSELPYYLDLPGLPLHRPSQHPSPDRVFNLKNLFVEIEYVADYKLTLQVTDTGALNPSANFIKNLPAAGTNLTLAVGGQLSEQADRSIDIYQSVDFARLVGSPENPRYTAVRKIPGHADKPFPKVPKSLAEHPYEGPLGESPCDHGALLGGRLGLKEALATYAISARMQDVAVLLTPGSTAGGTLYGQQISITGFSGYAFGQMDSQIDFTVLMDVNGGPNWTLAAFKGPAVTSAGGANGQNLLNFSRQVKDTLLITVLPVCIRQKYFPRDWLKYTPQQLANGARQKPTVSAVLGTLKGGNIDPKVISQQSDGEKDPLSLSYPIEYSPEMFFGTPIWANYLPSCLSPVGQAALAAAPGAARLNNQLQGIGNPTTRRP
jgi:hypothetical protein